MSLVALLGLTGFNAQIRTTVQYSSRSAMWIDLRSDLESDYLAKNNWSRIATDVIAIKKYWVAKNFALNRTRFFHVKWLGSLFEVWISFELIHSVDM